MTDSEKLDRLTDLLCERLDRIECDVLKLRSLEDRRKQVQDPPAQWADPFPNSRTTS